MRTAGIPCTIVGRFHPSPGETYFVCNESVQLHAFDSAPEADRGFEQFEQQLCSFTYPPGYSLSYFFVKGTGWFLTADDILKATLLQQGVGGQLVTLPC